MAPMLATLLLLLTALTAAAQTTYIGGSLTADIIRVSGTRDGLGEGNGEAIGGALRVGTPLGERWGVDLEFARSGDIEWAPDVNILANTGPIAVPGGISRPEIAIFPPPEIDSRQQLSTLATSLWWQQDIGERVRLVYLGGVAFTRSERDFRYSVGPIVLPTIPGGGIVRPPQVIESETVVYDAGIAVGMDAAIGITDHLQLVPGARLLNAAPGGWVIRPAVGLHWVF